MVCFPPPLDTCISLTSSKKVKRSGEGTFFEEDEPVLASPQVLSALQAGTPESSFLALEAWDDED